MTADDRDAVSSSSCSPTRQGSDSGGGEIRRGSRIEFSDGEKCSSAAVSSTVKNNSYNMSLYTEHANIYEPNVLDLIEQ